MTITFVLPSRVHLLDLSGPVHIFYEAAEYGADIRLQYCSPVAGGRSSTSSCELAFCQLEPFPDIEPGKDGLILVPGLEMPVIQSTEFQQSIHPFLQWLKYQHEEGVAIGSICTGAFLLGQAGLLEGRQCITHWKFNRLLQEQYPGAEVLHNRLFVESKGIYTSAGVASGIDLALYILEQRFGSRLAIDVAREVVVYLRRSKHDPQLSIHLQYRNHMESRIHQLQNWIGEHLDEAFTIEQLAEMAHISPRHLTRLFRKATGISIGEYTSRLKAETALQLLRQGHKVAYVATCCGFQSENQLRSLLAKQTGKRPSEI